MKQLHLASVLLLFTSGCYSKKSSQSEFYYSSAGMTFTYGSMSNEETHEDLQDSGTEGRDWRIEYYMESPERSAHQALREPEAWNCEEIFEACLNSEEDEAVCDELYEDCIEESDWLNDSDDDQESMNIDETDAPEEDQECEEILNDCLDNGKDEEECDELYDSCMSADE